MSEAACNADETRHSSLAELLFLGILFAISYTQAPLFYSNQNQYLLHGLAAAGLGDLHNDWLANTRDPTPLFSALVACLYKVSGWAIHLAYFVLLIVYFLSFWALVAALPGFGSTRLHRLVFTAAFTAIHSGIARLISVQLFGVDYPWYFQCGLAGQYVLGPGLQPSVFGVFLVSALAAFCHGRVFLAVVCTAAAATFHATYLLPAGLLTAGFMLALSRHGRWRSALLAGAIALLCVSPQLIYTFRWFSPTSPEQFAEAERLLAEVRIPHHASIARWFDGIAAAQLAWIVLGIGLVRRTALFYPLLIPAIGGTLLTLLQLAIGDNTLALIFPWRVSALLLPVATAIVLAKLIGTIPDTGRVARVAGYAAGGLLASAVIGGAAVMLFGWGYATNQDEKPLLEYVRTHHQPEDLYLLPVRIPPLATGSKGSISTSFTPPPRPKPGSNLIPIDLQSFRLATGAPIFIDFKSVPYADTEVLEWYRRMKLCQAWYETKDWDKVLEQIRAEGITHILVPRGHSISASGLERLSSEGGYTIYRVR